MARTACASMARIVQRCQEVQVRTWCSSRPHRPLSRAPSPQRRACSSCGAARRQRIVVQGRVLCQSCRTRLQRNPGTCPGCGAVRVLAFRDEQDRSVCAGCFGEEPTYRCRQCGREDNCYGASCGTCTLRDRATVLLTDPATGRIHPRLQPVFDALTTSDRPQTALYWLSRPPGHGPRVLTQMARGELEISHATFDQLPSDKSHNYLRDLLQGPQSDPGRPARHPHHHRHRLGYPRLPRLERLHRGPLTQRPLDPTWPRSLGALFRLPLARPVLQDRPVSSS